MRTVKIPIARLHQAHEVGPTAFLVYAMLLRRTNADGECWPSIQRIADDLHMDRKSIVYALHTLETGGWLSRRNRHGQATVYRMADDGEPGPKNGPTELVRKTDQPPGPKNGPQKIITPLPYSPPVQNLTRPPCGAPNQCTRGGYQSGSAYRLRAVRS